MEASPLDLAHLGHRTDRGEHRQPWSLVGGTPAQEKAGLHADGWLDEPGQLEASRGTVVPLGH